MNLKILTILALPAFVVTMACAQHSGKMGQLPIIVALDADRDGSISAAEIDRAPAALLTLDKNKDGKLSKEEYLSKDLAGHRMPFVLPILAALDANVDEVIDADEIAQSAKALRTLDKNSDGKLSREELAPKH